MRLGATSRKAVCVAIWAAGIAYVVWAGGWVDGYLLYVMGKPLPHPYPWRGVLGASASLSVLALVFYVLIRPESYRLSWGRALAGAGVGATAVVMLGMALMHAPPYQWALWHWLIAVTTILLGVFLVSAGARARRYLDGWRSTPPGA